MLTTILFVLGGIFLIVSGIFIAKTKYAKYSSGTMDKFGVDIQLLALGVLMVILGLAVIGHYL